MPNLFCYLPELFPLHSQGPCIFKERIAADHIITVAIIKEGCGSHGVMFCSHTGFYELYTKKTLEMVPWICRRTLHLAKVFVSGTFDVLLLTLNTSYHGFFLI